MIDHNSTGVPAGQTASGAPMPLAAVVAAVSPYTQCDGPNEEYPRGRFTAEAERRAYLEAALSGVELGSYDRRILDWLLQWDDVTVRVVVSLIVRARRASFAGPDAALLGVVRRGLAEAAAAREGRAAAPCEGCDGSPAGVCDAHAEDLDAAEQFRAAGRELAGGAR